MRRCAASNKRSGEGSLKRKIFSNIQMTEPKSTEKVRASSAQIAGAREFLRLTQVQLAKAAAVDPATVSTFETGTRSTHESTRDKLQLALEARGIVFTNGDRPGFYLDKEKVVIPT